MSLRWYFWVCGRTGNQLGQHLPSWWHHPCYYCRSRTMVTGGFSALYDFRCFELITGRNRAHLSQMSSSQEETELTFLRCLPVLDDEHMTPRYMGVLSGSSGASQVVLVVKNPPANAGDIRYAGSTPESGRSPGGGHGNPLQYSSLENPMDRGAWRATVHRVQRVRHD